jgi:hypothetical protein
VSSDIPVRLRGNGPHRVTVRAGVAEKVNATLKRRKRESRRGYAGNQPRHVVADAPNGCFSGSLGKRVSKPTLSSSNDRSSAMCRFESCRPHQYFSIARSWLELEDTPHLKRGAHSSVPVRVRRSAPLPKCLSRPWLELEYTLRSKRSAFGRAGSNPAGRTTFCGSLAQLSEHPVLTRQVEGSIPSRSTNITLCAGA